MATMGCYWRDAMTMRAITERRVSSGRARRHDNWSAEREWYKRRYDDNSSSSIDADRLPRGQLRAQEVQETSNKLSNKKHSKMLKPRSSMLTSSKVRVSLSLWSNHVRFIYSNYSSPKATTKQKTL